MWRILHAFLFVALVGIVISSCDIYKNENKDWTNDVEVDIRNLTICPVDISVNGVSKGTVEPGETLTLDNLWQGFLFLEAFPWDDDFHSCDSLLTDELKNGDVFTWEINIRSGCSICKPTPQPTVEPTETPAA